MRYRVTVTSTTIGRVKKLLCNNGIRETARRANVSYYTAWCVSKGKYDNDQPLQPKLCQNRCPITGFIIDKRIRPYEYQQD